VTSSQLLSLEPRRARADRTADRWVTVAAIAIAAAFLLAGGLSTLLPARVRLGTWLPLHLALAGASLSAIGGVMPFFTAALAAAPPADRRLRIGVVVLLSGGVAIAAVARTAGESGGAAVGGALVLIGLAGLLGATFGPLRRSLAPRRPFIAGAYAAAIVEVAVGVGLASADLGGAAPVTSGWQLLKPAHAWLNVLGFVSLVIATTLVHFLPTIAGTRIVPRRSLDVALAALAGGPALVAVGMAAASDALVRLGAAVFLAGCAALLFGAAGIVRARGGWTTDVGWHRFTLGSLLAALGWFALASLGAALPALVHGASPAAWDLPLVAAPISVGWAAQAIVGSAAHLLPAIGPGSPPAHRALRVALGRWTVARLAALNGGAALLTLGMLEGIGSATALGVVLAIVGVGTTVLLASAAIARSARGAQPVA
jgi:nitrite reductase (NO-forming)